MEMRVQKALSAVLNDYQMETIEAAIEYSSEISSLLVEMVDAYSDDELKEKVIDCIIIPFNMMKVKKETAEKIADGHWMVQGVFSDDDVNFAYTMGLSQLRNVELLCSGLNVETLGTLLNTVSQTMVDNPDIPVERFNAEDFPIFSIQDGEPGKGRYLIKFIDREKAIEEYTCLLPQMVDISGDVEIAVVILADKNNRLPGEEGYDRNFVQLFS